MPARPPLFYQETDYSCHPACLRMVLAAFNINKSEEELRQMTVCLLDGTECFGVVKAARECGLDCTRSYKLDFDDLKEFLQRQLFPIVEIKTRTSEQQPYKKHAVVVVEITTVEVIVLDPERGEYRYQIANFLREWQAANQTAILIEKC